MNPLSKLNNQKLLEDFSLVVLKEREAISEVISYLSHIWAVKLYAEAGYSSLFNFLVEKYHYSEGAAYRRIQAAKVYQRFPEVLAFLKDGSLNLMTLSLIEPHLNQDNGKDLIAKVLGKSKREVEEVLSELSLKKEKVQDVIRRLPVKNSAQNFTFTGESDLNKKDAALGVSQKEEKTSLEMSFSPSGTVINPVQETRKVKIEFVADEKVAKLIQRAKEVLRHKYPHGKLEDLVREAFELLLEKKDPQRKIQKRQFIKKEISQKEPGASLEMPMALSDRNIRTRYIPERIKQAVHKRDEGQCSYVSSDGKPCGERNFLEFDHIHPWSLGGDSTSENLRLLCRTHNQYRNQTLRV